MFHRYRSILHIVILSIYFSNSLKADVDLFRRIDLSAHSVKDCRLSLGDLNGDGEIDFIFNDGRRLIRAFDHRGNLLWEHINPDDPGVEETYHNFSISAYDIDIDQRDEVICFIEQEGRHTLTILDGASGEIMCSAELPFPAPRDHPFWGNTRFYMQNHIAVANLRGSRIPQDILAVHASKQKVAAYAFEADTLRHLWTWITDTDGYASGHYAYPYDIDSDGRDEVLAGVDVLNENGRRLWSMDLYPSNPSNPTGGMDHVDALACADIDPDHPGKEIVVAAATGIWMYDAYGIVLWHYPSRLTDPAKGLFNGEGIQEVLVGHFRKDLRGLQIVFFSEKMSGKHTVALFDAWGDAVLWDNQKSGPRRNIAYAIDWDGNRSLDEIYTRKGIFDGHFNRLSYSMNWKYVASVDRDEYPPVVCDVQGDQREEIVWYDEDEILIIKNTDLLQTDTLASPLESLTYRVRLANDNHCNAIYFDWSLLNEDPVRASEPSSEPLAASVRSIPHSGMTQQRISVIVETSVPVIRIPTPLILQTSDSSRWAIPLTGNVPGIQFTGIFHISALPEGPAKYILLHDSLVDSSGRKGNIIHLGADIDIDKTPPAQPRVIDLRRRRSDRRGH